MKIIIEDSSAHNNIGMIAGGQFKEILKNLDNSISIFFDLWELKVIPKKGFSMKYLMVGDLIERFEGVIILKNSFSGELIRYSDFCYNEEVVDIFTIIRTNTFKQIDEKNVDFEVQFEFKSLEEKEDFLKKLEEVSQENKNA